MSREPDWETLSEINFLINNRMTEQLFIALNALEKLDDQDNQRQRAEGAVNSALNMQVAWANLIRHKAGDGTTLPGETRFPLYEMLDWISTVLQIPGMPELDDTLIVEGNRETLQEALVLLHSCAHTLGPGARVVVDEHQRGYWFRVRYGATQDCPQTLSELLGRMQANWRLQSAAFELCSAGDFLEMNNCEMFYTPGERMGELAFFVKAVRPTTQRKKDDTRTKTRTLLDTYNADETHRVITDSTD